MHRLLLALPVLPVLACATAQVAAPVAKTPERRTLVRRILSENVRLILYEGKEPRRTASGVVIAAERTAEGSCSYVVTNAHVVDAVGLTDPHLTAVTEQNEYQTDLLAVGRVPEMDLALLRVWGTQLTPAEMAAEGDAIPGDAVIVAGAPFGRPVSVSGGMVSQIELDPKTQKAELLKTDAPIGYGASGGGVYSADTGRLLAIVEGYRTAKIGFEVAQQTYTFDVPMPGETFAAPISKLRAFLSGKGYQRFLGAAKRSQTSIHCASGAECLTPGS